MTACTSEDTNQHIRDNETTITAGDKVDDHQTPRDTVLLTDSLETPEITN